MPYKDLTFLLFAKDMSATRGFEKVALSGDRMSKGLAGSMGMAAVAVAGLAIAVGAKSVRMAADFQTATTRLVTDAGESKSNLQKVSDGILDISASVGTAATDLAKGGYYIESAGYHGAAGLKVLKAAAEGAKIGGADLVTVSDALTTAMKDYGVPASKATNITSELIATVSRGKTTMEDLAGSLHSVLPNAEAVGISLNDVLGALATMTQEGISADQATQNLNHTIVSLADPTNVQSQEMAAMGLNATKVAKDLGKKGLTGTLDELVEAITTHMGKGGLVLQKTFTNSQLAAQSANTMFKSLPSAVKTVAAAYEAGSISQKTWTTAVKAMTPAQANLAKQWAATENKSKGFSDLLKSGKGNAQTFTAALAKMTGGQTGLQVALHLTGIHAADTTANVKEIGAAAKGTQKNVKDWDVTQKTFNQNLDKANASFGKAGIQIGTALMPALQELLPVVPKVAHGFEVAAPAIGLVAGALAWVLEQSPIVMLGDAADAIKGLNNPTKDLSDALKGKFGPALQFAAGVGKYFGTQLRLLVTDGEHVVAGFGDIGQHIVSGLVGGVEKAWGGVTSTINGLVSQIPVAVRDLLGIHSPSTVFRDIGGYVGKGLEQGLLGSVPQIQSASTRLANTVISSFKAGDISTSAEGAALHTIDTATTRLQKLSTKRATVEAQLKSAQSSLSDLKSDRSSMSSSTKSSTVAAGDVTQFSSSGDMLQGLQDLLTNTNRFKGDLQKLAKKGVDPVTFGQLVNGWQADPQGALRAADQLLANPMDLKQIVALQKQLGTAAGSLGSFSAHQEYDGSIASTTKTVSKLKGEDKVLDWRMQKIAETMLKKAAAEAHIHLHLTGTYAGTKDDLAKTVLQAFKDAVKKGIIPKSALAAL